VKKQRRGARAPDAAGTVRPRTAAVIDLGSASVRLAVAQIESDGSVRPLETLEQAVPIGRDSFSRGEISRQTIEECVRVIERYRRTLAEYQVTEPDQLRAVASAAVREAVNRDALLDRVYIATGISVQPLDEADINRLTYLGLYSQIVWDAALASGPAVVAAMEGGSTDVLFLEKGMVTFARNYRLGSLRLQKMLETYRAPALHERELMEDYVRRTVEAICRALPERRNVSVLALGSEARFAAARLAKGWDREALVRLPLAAYGRLAADVLAFSADDAARRYHLPSAGVEMLAPTLYFYERLARSLRARALLVSGRTMRYGVLLEMARRGLWVSAFGDQIMDPARAVGRKYHTNEAHAEHTAALCRELFRALQPEHQLGPWHEVLLTVAALLHDVGLFVSERSHHKHSMYLIYNSELFGLSQKDRLIVALIARYHRRSGPRAEHEGYGSLGKEDRVAVAKLAAILRVADALDRSYSQRVHGIACVREPGRLVIEVPGVVDLSLETLALRGKGPLFQDVYGMEVALRPGAQRAG